MEKELSDSTEAGLKERDLDLLQTINEEELTNFTFEGLKRRSQVHPETLSRILSRLTEEEIVKKTKNDYTLTEKAKKILETQTLESDKLYTPLLQTVLPHQILISKIVSSLKGKWFGTLRWLGYSTTSENITLKWITEDGRNIISAVFSQGKLCIKAKIVSEIDLDAAINASHQLMTHIAKHFSKTRHN